MQNFKTLRQSLLGELAMSPEEREKEEIEKNAIYSGHLRLCQQPRAAHALRSDQQYKYASQEQWDLCTHPEHLPGNAKFWIFKYSAYFLTCIDVHDKRDIKGIKRAKNIPNGSGKNIKSENIHIFNI